MPDVNRMHIHSFEISQLKGLYVGDLTTVFQFKSEDRREANVPVERKSDKKNFLTWGRVSLFVLFRPSTDWTRPTHTRESNLLYLLN